MFGKKDARKKLIARTALKLYMAVLVEDKGELYDLMTGPESDDDGTAGALMLFWVRPPRALTRSTSGHSIPP